MGFTRRYSDFPGTEVLTEIEGVVTVDSPPPGQIAGVQAGVACVIGEFADVTYGVSIDATGGITTKPQPVELFTPQDRLNKLGGFDETLGEFGGDGGNGYVEISNKTFSRLVAVPINVAASQGARLWRDLPTNKSATEPTPVVPMVGGTVPAGREFKTGNSRVRLAQRVAFSESQEFGSGVDGAVTAAGSAAGFQVINCAGALFTQYTRPDGTTGVKVGDIFVLGVVGASGAQGANARTYRVRVATSDTQLTLERMDGSSFDWTTGTALAWRVHAAECADTGGENHIGTQAGYRVPVRPLDATISTGTNLAPTVVPEAVTSQSADALSGLAMRSAPTTGIVFVSAVHTPNTATNATLEALYALAFDALLSDSLPAREVNIVWPARTSSAIDVKQKSHLLTQKANGRGRIGLIAPPLDTISISTVIGDSAPGVGANRARERIFNWPGVQTFVREAVGVSIKGADGNTYTDGILDVPSTSFSACIMSRLAPERNPAQSSSPVDEVMSLVLGMQRGAPELDMNVYKQLRAKGVMAPRNDRDTGWQFQSGVTTSQRPGEKEINTRRFSFFVQDSVAAFLAPFSKEPMSESLKDQIVGAFHDFFDDLLSEQNRSRARIRAYAVDPRSANTPELEEAGVYVVKYEVEMIPIANVIVQQASIGYGVIDVQNLAA